LAFLAVTISVVTLFRSVRSAVPEMVSVPLPPLNTRPLGSFPAIRIDGVGAPVLVTVNEKGVPATTVAVLRLVMVGDGLAKALNCTASTVSCPSLLRIINFDKPFGSPTALHRIGMPTTDGGSMR